MGVNDLLSIIVIVIDVIVFRRRRRREPADVAKLLNPQHQPHAYAAIRKSGGGSDLRGASCTRASRGAGHGSLGGLTCPALWAGPALSGGPRALHAQLWGVWWEMTLGDPASYRGLWGPFKSTTPDGSHSRHPAAGAHSGPCTVQY